MKAAPTGSADLQEFSALLRTLHQQSEPGHRLNDHLLRADMHDTWRWAYEHPETVAVAMLDAAMYRSAGD